MQPQSERKSPLAGKRRSKSPPLGGVSCFETSPTFYLCEGEREASAATIWSLGAPEAVAFFIMARFRHRISGLFRSCAASKEPDYHYA